MPGARKQHLKALQPYLVGEGPGSDGEWDMHCPLHEDTTRSARINIDKGVWVCYAGCGGGRIAQLIRRRSEWVDPAAAGANGAGTRRRKKSDEPAETITEAKIKGWVAALQANDEALNELLEARGLDNETVTAYDIGWDSKHDAYTIPVRGDDDMILNVRRYQLHPPEGRRKIWSVKGMGTPQLYPLSVFDDDPKEIIVCGGEWDALLTIQNGFPCVTRTASEITWNAEWGEYFKDRIVYLAHDADTTGRNANRKVGRLLARTAKEVRLIKLPFETVDKHGKDLTDFWLENNKAAFKKLLRSARLYSDRPEPEGDGPSDVSVLDSFDSKLVGKPMRLRVTIKGKREPGYTVPATAHFTCTRDAGPKCKLCPMMSAGGEDKIRIDASEPIVLDLIESTTNQMLDAVRRFHGALKCEKLNISILDYQAVEVLYARPSVDHAGSNRASAADYKNIKLVSVGRHDTLANNTVQVIGARHPEPRKQMNEFLAWDVSRLETSIDRFEPDSKSVKRLRRFRPEDGQTPLQKLGDIARDLSNHVTFIYGRPEMHAAMDLVFHSLLSFNFAGQRLARGWLELVIVGDTRTGKSEAATKLVKHFGAGELISCEAATFAGVVGGLQNFGRDGREWAVSWGAIPINDRRLVVLDEISGLSQEEISQMSSMRSSGVAELQKIQQEKTVARTRLIWLGNPRNKTMASYTYGVQAIRPLIGNAEDIARFDMAMSVALGEVPQKVMNQPASTGRVRYGSEACHDLIRWAWSRKPDQVIWARGAEDSVYESAAKLGASYVEDPPLVQAADIRVKVARVAAAIAARTFSSDRYAETVIIRRSHVKAAMEFLNRLYEMPGFGYAERSNAAREAAKIAHSNTDNITSYLVQHHQLPEFLRMAEGQFRRSDLEEMLNLSREQANSIINTLWDSKMIRKDGPDIRIEPPLHRLLREVK